MDTRDVATPEGTRAKQLCFDRYVLDLDRGCLLLDRNEIVLRPKTFSVLRYLVENSGRLVSKDDLFAAVWPNVAVTDDTLVQSISELRRVIGDDGARLIRTIPRRGYRFEAAVTDPATVRAATPEPDAADALVPSSELPEKVARTGHDQSVAIWIRHARCVRCARDHGHLCGVAHRPECLAAVGYVCRLQPRLPTF